MRAACGKISINSHLSEHISAGLWQDFLLGPFRSSLLKTGAKWWQTSIQLPRGLHTCSGNIWGFHLWAILTCDISCTSSLSCLEISIFEVSAVPSNLLKNSNVIAYSLFSKENNAKNVWTAPVLLTVTLIFPFPGEVLYQEAEESHYRYLTLSGLINLCTHFHKTTAGCFVGYGSQ